SLVPLLEGKSQPGRDLVFVERERHANVRKGDLSFPARAVRTKEFLFIQNLKPDRWPAGDPEFYKAVGPFGDCDASPTKEVILTNRGDDKISKFFGLCFDKRPGEELYDLAKDPDQIVNVASQAAYGNTKEKLRRALDTWLKETGDPRVTADDDRWEKYPYFGDARRMPEQMK